MVWYCFLLWLYLLTFQTCCILLYCVFVMSAFIFIQFTASLAKSHFYNAHIVAVQLFQFLTLQHKSYNYSFAFYGNAIDHCLIMSDWSMLLDTLFPFICFSCGWPYIVYDFSFCRSASSQVTICMSSLDVHIGIFTDVMTVCILMPEISWSLFSVWLCRDNQSAMYRSGLGLYRMYTQYW